MPAYDAVVAYGGVCANHGSRTNHGIVENACRGMYQRMELAALTFYYLYAGAARCASDGADEHVVLLRRVVFYGRQQSRIPLIVVKYMQVVVNESLDAELFTIADTADGHAVHGSAHSPCTYNYQLFHPFTYSFSPSRHSRILPSVSLQSPLSRNATEIGLLCICGRI